MYVAGIDIGAATAKVVILGEKGILTYTILPTGPDVVKVAKKVMKDALKKAQLSWKEVSYIVATGYGRFSVPFPHKSLTEIYCHAKGAKWLIPTTKMIIDIGGQDSKAIKIDVKGEVADFVMNDKCAAGSGRFLEVIARVLKIRLEDLGYISLKSKNLCQISSVCTVFAESEVVSLRAEKKSVEDIIAGIHKSIAKRVVTMASQIGREDSVVFTGGVAKNIGMKKALEEELCLPVTVPEEPQIVGALGAALVAKEIAGNISNTQF